MNDRSLTDLCPELQVLAQQFLDQCHAEGIRAFITETFRSEEDQNSDYAKGRSTPGVIITNAKFGQSPHNCTTLDGTPSSCAFDFGIVGPNGALDWDASDAAWQQAIAIGEGLGLVSGSTWHSPVDAPHLELPNWKTNQDT